MKSAFREAFFQTLAAANPNPQTELHYRNPFTLLVAVVLSAQATDASVNKATPALFAKADTPEEMAKLGADGIRPFIKTIGLYQGKAKNIAALSAVLLKEHQGEVPHDRAALERLPGVGRKTANVVLSVVFGEATIAVDTHVFRVANRTGLAMGKTTREVEEALLKKVPAWARRHAHHWLILHGRYVCKARAPACKTCAVRHYCAYKQKPAT